MNKNLQKWSINGTLIVGNTMLSGIDERSISKIDRKVKVKIFPGATTIDDIYDYIKSLLKKCTDNIILHVGTNNTVNEPSNVVLGKLLDLKKFIENNFLESNVIISNLITLTDNGKTSLTAIKTNEHSHGLQMDIIDNGNTTSNEPNKGGLHLNPRGLGKLVINFIRRIKKFGTICQVTGSFHKASSFDSQINCSSFTNLGNTEKPDQSTINRVNETFSEETLKK